MTKKVFMGYGIIDLVTDQVLGKNNEWVTRDVNESRSEVYITKHINTARKRIQKLTKEFLDYDPGSQINFRVIKISIHYFNKLESEWINEDQ